MTLKKFGIGAGVLFVLGLLVYYVVFPISLGAIGLVGNTYSEGYRDVYIQKVTKKGNIKVWEVDAGYHGGMVFQAGAGKSYSSPWTANFDNAELFDVFKKIRGDELVRVYYKERYVKGLDTSSYLIEKVEKLDDILPRKQE
jgi:hypothetical protein